jgi:hypothetical protein
MIRHCLLVLLAALLLAAPLHADGIINPGTFAGAGSAVDNSHHF